MPITSKDDGICLEFSPRDTQSCPLPPRTAQPYGSHGGMGLSHHACDHATGRSGSNGRGALISGNSSAPQHWPAPEPPICVCVYICVAGTSAYSVGNITSTARKARQPGSRSSVRGVRRVIAREAGRRRPCDRRGPGIILYMIDQAVCLLCVKFYGDLEGSGARWSGRVYASQSCLHSEACRPIALRDWAPNILARFEGCPCDMPGYVEKGFREG